MSRSPITDYSAIHESFGSLRRRLLRKSAEKLLTEYISLSQERDPLWDPQRDPLATFVRTVLFNHEGVHPAAGPRGSVAQGESR